MPEYYSCEWDFRDVPLKIAELLSFNGCEINLQYSSSAFERKWDQKSFYKRLSEDGVIRKNIYIQVFDRAGLRVLSESLDINFRP